MVLLIECVSEDSFSVFLLDKADVLMFHFFGVELLMEKILNDCVEEDEIIDTDLLDLLGNVVQW